MPVRTRWTLGGVAVVVAVVLAAVGLRSDGAGASAASGPTATAADRTLQVTASRSGTLARADTTTVVYDGTGGHDGGGPTGSNANVRAQSATAATVAEIASDCPSPSSTSSTSTTSTSVPCPTTTTTAPTTTTTEPPTTTTTEPAPEPDPQPDGPADSQADGQADQQASPRDGQVAPGPSAGDATTPDSNGTGTPTATLTAELPIGQIADRGAVLYRADDEPVVALLADHALFRDLAVGVDDGPDVQALEANLVALGHGAGLTVDDHFDAATAARVKDWETALGRTAPDGVVTVGEVVFLREPTSVLAQPAAVGDLLEPGDPVLVLGAESRIVTSSVLPKDLAGWAVGTAVTLDWGDGTTSAGTVTEVSRDEADGAVPITVTIGADGDAASLTAADRPIGSAVKVVRTVADRAGALAVPVAAVIGGPKGPSVRVVGGGQDKVVPVTLGVVAGGWVEVTHGLEAGAKVRLPA